MRSDLETGNSRFGNYDLEMIWKLWDQIRKLRTADSETMIWKLRHVILETITADSETMIRKLWFENYEVRFRCGNCSNNTRDLCSVATYNVRSTRNVNMRPPTPPHHDLRMCVYRSVRFTSTVFGPLAWKCMYMAEGVAILKWYNVSMSVWESMILEP